MRTTINGVEYVSGYEFLDEFVATTEAAISWREEGIPYKRAEELDMEEHGSEYYYPVEACHAWFRGEEVAV